ncbi:MAG: DUF4387 domain-containing protein [Syntrophobacteraceae bacterium]
MSKRYSITELADVIRSKNSGPFELTFDIIFRDFETYYEVKEKGVINKALIAKLYHITEDEVLTLASFDPAKAIKATIVRPLSSGGIGETDVYGSQQHAPLLSIEIEL